MRTVRAPELQRFTAAVFEANGACRDAAETVAAALVRASLLGHDSHGVLRIARYVEKIRAGTLQPAGRPSIAHEHGAIAVIDGGLGFGQVAAAFGTQVVLRLAHTHGIGAVSLSRTNHLGRLGDYAERIAAAGCIGLVLASGAGPGGSVAAFGGRERLFGTNPLAWAIPVGADRGPLVADFATSAIPEGRVALALARGEPLPPSALLDSGGHASANPADFYAGGALLPFGGHKGASLVLLIEVVANLLAHSVPASSPEYRPGNPALLIAIEVGAFLPPDEYHRHTETLLRRIETSLPAEGTDRVRLPNGPELETAARREATGIPVPDALWRELEDLGRSAGTPWPP
jgi:LDH2 family malate/lactate/ureidoglycolate dehydrogenase